MPTFEQLQVGGMSPSLLRNALGLPSPVLSRLFSKIEVTESGCWKWAGAKARGYGVIKIWSIRRAPLPVHRLCYELVNGKITESGMDVHHKVESGCIGPSCCNPDHLEPILHTRHFEVTPNGIAFRHAAATACVHGHPYGIETVRIGADGRRRCLVCERKRAQAIRDAALVKEGREKFKWRAKYKKTHCLRGHVLTQDNLYRQPSNGTYSCLACRLIRREAWLAKRRKNS